jgi:hypothetical protein
MVQSGKHCTRIKVAIGLIITVWLWGVPMISFAQYFKYTPWYPPAKIQKNIKAWYVGLEAGVGSTQFNYTDYDTRIWPQKLSVQPSLAIYARAMFNSKWGITPSLAYYGFQHTHYCYIPIRLHTNIARISFPINRSIGEFNSRSWQVYAGPYIGIPFLGYIQSADRKIETNPANLFPFDFGFVGGISTRFSLKGEDLGLVFKYQLSHSMVNSYGIPERTGAITELGGAPTPRTIGARFYLMNHLTIAIEIRRANYIMSKSKYDYLVKYYSKRTVKRCLKQQNKKYSKS